MGVSDVFRRVFGVLGSLGPVFARFQDIAVLVGSVIKIGTSTSDVAKIQAACVEGRELAAAIRRLADELDEGFGELEQAVDATSAGGDDITAAEGIDIAQAFKDVGPAIAQIGSEADDTLDRLRALLP